MMRGSDLEEVRSDRGITENIGDEAAALPALCDEVECHPCADQQQRGQRCGWIKVKTKARRTANAERFKLFVHVRAASKSDRPNDVA